MSWFGCMSRKEIQERYSHKGLAFGIIPVYISSLEEFAPEITCRNFIPDFLLEGLCYLYMLFLSIADPYGIHSEGFPILITGTTK